MVGGCVAQPGGDAAGTGAPKVTKEDFCTKVSPEGDQQLSVGVDSPLLDTSDAIVELEQRLMRLEQRHMGTTTQMQEMAAMTVHDEVPEQSCSAINMGTMPNALQRCSEQAPGLQLQDVYDVDWDELQKVLQETTDEPIGRSQHVSRHSLPARLPLHQPPTWPVPAGLQPPQSLSIAPSHPPTQPNKPLQQRGPQLFQLPLQSPPPTLSLQPAQDPGSPSVGRRRRASAPCDLEHIEPMEAPRGKPSLRFCEPEVIFHETYDSPSSARIEHERGSSSHTVEGVTFESHETACEPERVEATDALSPIFATPSSSRTTPSPDCRGQFCTMVGAIQAAEEVTHGTDENESDSDEDINDGLEELMVSSATIVNDASPSHMRHTEALPCLADDDLVHPTEPTREVDVHQYQSQASPIPLDSEPCGTSAASVFSQQEASPVSMDRIPSRTQLAAPSSWRAGHDTNVSDFSSAFNDRSSPNCWSSPDGGFIALDSVQSTAYPQSLTMSDVLQPCIHESWPPRQLVTSSEIPFQGCTGAAQDRCSSKSAFVDNGDASGGCEPWGVKNRLRHLFDTCALDGNGRASRRDLFKACRASPEFFRLPQAFPQGDVAGGHRAVSWNEFWERFSQQGVPSTDIASRLTVSPRLGDAQPPSLQQSVEVAPPMTEEPWTAGRSPPQQERHAPVVDEYAREPAVPLFARPVQQWDEGDVAQWLARLSAVPPDIMDVVHRHAISGPVLLSLSDQDLAELGIQKFGHRRLLLLAAQELRAAVTNHRRSHVLSPGRSSSPTQEATRSNHTRYPLAPALDRNPPLPYAPMPEQINPGRSPVSSLAPSLDGGDVALGTSPQPHLPPVAVQRALSYPMFREVVLASPQSSSPAAQVRVVQSPGHQQRGSCACPVAPNVIPVRHMHHAAYVSSLGQRQQNKQSPATFNFPVASVTVPGISSPGRQQVAWCPQSRVQLSPGRGNVRDNTLPRSLSPATVPRTASPMPTGLLRLGMAVPRAHRQVSPPHHRRQDRVWRS